MISVDLPEPETPVTQTNRPTGRLRSTAFRLFPVAPRMRSRFLADGRLRVPGTWIDRARERYFPVRESLGQVGFYSAAQLMATFAAKKPEIDPWIADAQLNRDRNLRLQYLAGLGMNLYQADMIYRDMERYRTYPTGLFTGSPERMAQLQASWQSSGE